VRRVSSLTGLSLLPFPRAVLVLVLMMDYDEAIYSAFRV
jgi:hypothetical protein